MKDITDKPRTDKLCIRSKFDNLTLYTCSSILYFHCASESLLAFSLDTLFHRQIFYEYRVHDHCDTFLWKYWSQTISTCLISLAYTIMYWYKMIAHSYNFSALHFAFIMIIADISITIAPHVVSENIGLEIVANRSVMADFFS